MYGSILITSVLGGIASALLALDAGAGMALCLLAYGVGGALSFTAAAVLHMAFPEDGVGPQDGPPDGPPRPPRHGDPVKVRVQAQARNRARR